MENFWRYFLAIAAGGIYLTIPTTIYCAFLLLTMNMGPIVSKASEWFAYLMLPLIIGVFIYGFRSYLAWDKTHPDEG